MHHWPGPSCPGPHPWGPYFPCDPHGWAPHCGVVMSFIPVVCAPMPYPCAPAPYPLIVLKELAAEEATSPQDAVIGGSTTVHLTLECLVDTAPGSATVTITSAGTTTTWSDAGIAAGYLVKDRFMPAAPGAKVRLEAKSAAARLRWCETICC